MSNHSKFIRAKDKSDDWEAGLMIPLPKHIDKSGEEHPRYERVVLDTFSTYEDALHWLDTYQQ